MSKRIIILIIAIYFALCLNAYCKENFPALYKVTASKVNVRAGYNVNFEILEKIVKDENVIVVGKEYGWYKVKLKQNTPCYVSSKYVKTSRIKPQAIITGNRINVRSRPDLKSTVLCQIGSVDKVTVIEKKGGDWYAVKPPEKCFGWVLGKNLQFVSNKIPEEKLRPEPVIKKEVIEIAASESKPVTLDKQKPVSADAQAKKTKSTLKPKKAIAEKKSTNKLDAVGIIKPMGRFFGRPGTHKLMQKKKLVCYLKGDTKLLNSFVNQRVKLTGTITSAPSKKYPTVKVEEIKISK